MNAKDPTENLIIVILLSVVIFVAVIAAYVENANAARKSAPVAACPACNQPLKK